MADVTAEVPVSDGAKVEEVSETPPLPPAEVEKPVEVPKKRGRPAKPKPVEVVPVKQEVLEVPQEAAEVELEEGEFDAKVHLKYGSELVVHNVKSRDEAIEKYNQHFGIVGTDNPYKVTKISR